MNRYSYVHGTLESGVYSAMGYSGGLAPFLNQLGAANLGVTIDFVRNTISGFKELEGYRQQPRNDLPVAMRYAPMHLYKRSDMPRNMKAFSAICVSGAEGRPGRFTVYSQTTFIGREEMHRAVTVKNQNMQVQYNYLDQIFGTYMLSGQDMNSHRDGTEQIDYDRLPQKVVPIMRHQDQNVVFQTIKAVYADKAVVIRLEDGCSFNSRARELLLQIYSLLQPRLATEIGFATYHDPSDIGRKIVETSMRIFILPSACSLKDVENGSAVILDLSAPETLPAPVKDEMTIQLHKWSSLPWELRQQSMEAIFADTVTSFLDKELFLQRTKAFFSDPFFSWERNSEDSGTITTLEQLRNKYDSFPLCRQIPWVKERFIRKIPSLMAKNIKLKQLGAEAVAQGLYAKDDAQQRVKQEEYVYAVEMGGSDVISSCRATEKLITAQLHAEFAVALDLEREKTAKAVSTGETAVFAEKKKTAMAIAEGEAAVALEKEKAAKAIAAEKKKTAMAIAEGEAAVALEKEKAAKAIAAEKKEKTQIQQALNEKKILNEKLALELKAEQQEKDELAQRFEKAKTAYLGLEKQKTKLESDIGTLQAEVETVRAEVTSVKRKAAEAIKVAKEEAEEAKAEAARCRALLNAYGIPAKQRRQIILTGVVCFLVALVLGILGTRVYLDRTAKSAEETFPINGEVPASTASAPPTQETTTALIEPVEEDIALGQTTNKALMERVPQIKVVETEEWDKSAVGEEGYHVIAVFLTEETADDNYLVWFERDRDEVLIAETETEAESTAETEAESTAETEAESTAETEAASTAETEVDAPVETQSHPFDNACVIMDAGQNALVAYGETHMMNTAFRVFSEIFGDREPAEVTWYSNGKEIDMSMLMTHLLETPDWRDKIVDVSADEQVLENTKEMLLAEKAPSMCIYIETDQVCIFTHDTVELAESFANKMLDMGHTAVLEGQTVAVIPMLSPIG